MPRKPSLARSLLRSLDAATCPIYLLDAQRRILYGNGAFSRWVGRPADDLAGVRCDYHASGEVSGSIELAAALCPPPTAFTGELASGSVAGPTAQGKLDSRPARFTLLSIESGEQVLLVVVDPSGGSAQQEQNRPGPLSAERLHAALLRLRGELGRRYHIGGLLGESDAMRRVRRQARLASQTGLRVLIVGPPGSGRQHVARAIHYGQPAASIGSLVPIDCPLVDAEAMQGVLTSLLRRQADAPTERPPAALLLAVDGLGEGAQHELAGFLQLPGVELQLLATARAPLTRRVAKGKFRRDLAYALSTLTIALPPLAGRAGDVPLLAQFFLEEFNSQGKGQLSGFAPQAIEHLTGYPWPDNVAELAGVVCEACQRAAGSLVLASDLPDRIHLADGAVAHAAVEQPSIDLDAYLAQIEKELIERALGVAKNNKTRAAQLLGVNRARLLRRLVQLGLTPPPADDEPVVFEPHPEEP